MSALTSERDTVEISNGARCLVLPVKGATTIYQGAIVALDANGYAIPGKTAEGLIAAGRAEETVINAGANGAASVRVTRGTFVFDNTATVANKVGITHVLGPCYIEDDQTVTALATGASIAGKVIRVDDEGVVVEIGMSNIDLKFVEAAVLLEITGTGVDSGDVFDGFVLTGIAADETVIIDGKTYTKKAATSDADNQFADFAGLASLAATDGIIIIGSSFANVKASKVSA